jgi:subtilase family serine protease
LRILAWLAPAALGLALIPVYATAAPVAFGAQSVGRPAAALNVPFLVHLPLRNQPELEQLVTLQGTPGTQAYHHWLTPAQFRAQYGANPAQLAAAANALRSAGVTVDAISSQFITAHAPVAVVERTFGAQIATFRGPSGRLHVGSSVGLTLPATLRALGADVEGLVYHGEGRSMLRGVPAGTDNRFGLLGDLYFDDIKQAYKFPSYLFAKGTGVRIATVNDADFSSADLITYLDHEKIGNGSGDLAPLPTVLHAAIPGSAGFINDPLSDSFEADVDTQQVAGMAPGATLTGWTTNAAIAFPVDFLLVYDVINETNSEDIVSTSYGEAELFFTAAYNGGVDLTGILAALHSTFLQGNAEGITYTVSSGDFAGRGAVEVGYLTHPNAGKTYSTVPGVEIPASDPNVVAVGGGNLITSSNPDNSKDLNSRYITENAFADRVIPQDLYRVGNTVRNIWWGAGGGQSVVFAKPAWQKGKTPGTTRSVPDIGLFVGGCFPPPATIFVQPCPDDVTHAIVTFAGNPFLGIGTSIAAPEAAGLLATIEDSLGSGKVAGSGRLGNVNPLLYGGLPAAFYHEAIPGYNGVVRFSGKHVWNPSYGLGSLFNQTPFTTSALTPQTPSNP